jgi:hypothetical protein
MYYFLKTTKKGKINLEVKAVQQELFTFPNPFKLKFNDWINEQVPMLPGVYRFYDVEKKLLYVGKSKTLRKRLKSYGNLHPNKDSKRLIRLIHSVHTIDFEISNTEKEALLLENKWLRTQKPPYNRTNTKPELHLFVGLSKKKDVFEIGWTLSEAHHAFDGLYGAFRGMSITYALLCALLSEKSILAKKWFIKRPPVHFELDGIPENWIENVLNGTSLELDLFESLMDSSTGFIRKIVYQDISTVMRWFVYQGLTHKAIKERFNVKSQTIGNVELDDWLVKLTY